ncbi:MAG: polyphosphate polymerase domain-containing protein [Clostridiales Family XIII bacterium]|jgi:hypothetical protein|nr:polyphosphate polymerase domain-containing protein [Clostridiales Family XIII bacterium]
MMKMRHEYKHRLHYGDYMVLVPRLRALMRRDEHAGADGKYRVRSLYFDTPDDRALREKQDGVDRREKFRIRRYPGTQDVIHLEKKIKIHGLCHKSSAPVTAEEVRRILSGDVAWMAHDGRPLVCELWHGIRGRGMKPKVVIEYVREPFVYAAGRVRVTFDTMIRTGLAPQDFLADGTPMLPAGEEIVLLEVKYDEYLPSFIEDLLQVGSRRAEACSKYALGRCYG